MKLKGVIKKLKGGPPPYPPLPTYGAETQMKKLDVYFPRPCHSSISY